MKILYLKEQALRKYVARFITVAGLLAVFPLWASEEDLYLLYSDEQAVSIATGSTKPLRLAPSVASVISQDEIKALGLRTLDEALETIAGVHVSESFNRLNSIFSIRGIHTQANSQVLVLLNGVPISEVITGGRANTFRMPTTSISRIEVIRGPGSAVYGADAFSGVINVITKSAKDIDGFQFGARAGSFKSRDAWLQYGGRKDNWDISFSLDILRSDGDRDRVVQSDLQTTLDPTFGTSASNAPGPLETRYDVSNLQVELKNSNWSFRAWSWTQDDAGVGPGSSQALDPTGSQDIDQYLFDIEYKNSDSLQDWQLAARAYRHFVEDSSTLVVLPAGSTVPIGGDGNTFTPADPACPTFPVCLVNFPEGVIGKPVARATTDSLEVSGIYTGTRFHRLRLAGGVKRQDVETGEKKNFGPGVIDGTVSPIDGTLTDVSDTVNVYMQDQDRTIRYVSLQDEWTLAPDWELTAGVRIDKYSDFGTTTNPRLALVWSIAHNLTSKLLYGRAFRAPSFSEQFFINNPSLLGNPDLEPETIDTLELVFDYLSSNQLSSTVSLFTYKIDDLIEFVADPLPATTIRAQNSGSQRGYGLEWEVRWKASNSLDIKSNIVLQNVEDDETGQDIADAPQRQIGMSGVWRFLPGWLASAQATWIAERARASSDMRKSIDDYTLMDVTLRYAPTGNSWEAAVLIKNLLDENAYEPSNGFIPDDYPLPGRSIFAEFNVSY